MGVDYGLGYRLSLIILPWLTQGGNLASTKADSFFGILLSVVKPQTLNSLAKGPRQKPFHHCHGELRLWNLVQKAQAIQVAPLLGQLAELGKPSTVKLPLARQMKSL